MDTVALSFVFDKNCLIMDYLGLKDSSRQLRVNCVISYSFYLHLMLYACAVRFDVTGNLEKNWILGGMPKLTATGSSRAVCNCWCRSIVVSCTKYSEKDLPF